MDMSYTSINRIMVYTFSEPIEKQICIIDTSKEKKVPLEKKTIAIIERWYSVLSMSLIPLLWDGTECYSNSHNYQLIFYTHFLFI